MYYPSEKTTELLDEKNGVLYAINVRHYQGVVLDFEVSQKCNTDCEDEKWCECLPSAFSNKEVQTLLNDHIQEIEEGESEQSASAEAYADFQSNQRY